MRGVLLVSIWKPQGIWATIAIFLNTFELIFRILYKHAIRDKCMYPKKLMIGNVKYARLHLKY